MESRYSQIFADLEKRLMSEHDVAIATVTSDWSDADKIDLEEALRRSKAQCEKEIITSDVEKGERDKDVSGDDDIDRERILNAVAGEC